MIPEATPLQQGHFRLTAPSGFGDGLNHYGHSMAWFRGKLFVGTTRGAMQMNKTNMPRPDLKPWPVDCPNDIYEVDRHAEIWCYDPATRGWTRVYRAPEVSGRNGRMVPRYIGYRGLAVFQGAARDQACLSVSTWAPAATDPPEILRSEDGQHFAPAARPPFSDFVRSFRTLQPYRGRIPEAVFTTEYEPPTTDGSGNVRDNLRQASADGAAAMNIAIMTGAKGSST